jgi:DNA-binding NarL/FixJ family response regulator
MFMIGGGRQVVGGAFQKPDRQFNMGPLRILLADDHEVVRCGLRTLIESHPGFRVADEAVDGQDAVEKARKLHPDVVVMDISMPRLNGLQATKRILRENPTAKILVLTMHNSEQIMKAVIEAGAKGYLLKSDAGGDLFAAVEALMKHRTFFTSQAVEMILEGNLHPPSELSPAASALDTLTPREREVARLLAEGKSTKKAAALLGIKVRTAEVHRSHIMRKLRLECASDFVRYAARNGNSET